MKKLAALLLAHTLVFLILAGAMLSFIAVFTSNEKTDEEEDESDIEELLVEPFTISGKHNKNGYNLTFSFDGWSISGIKFEGDAKTVTMTVKVPAISASDREAAAYQYLRKKGFTSAGACGLMANIAHEGGSWKSNTEEGGGSYRGETPINQGYGLCQWTNSRGSGGKGRRYAVINYLKKKKLAVDKDSDAAFFAELDYAISGEPAYSNIVKRVKTATSIDEATRIWCVEWEVPQDRYNQAKKRTQTAKKYMDKFGGGKTTSNSGKKKNATLSITLKKSGDKVTFSGTLDGTSIAGSFNATGASVNGSGEYGEGAGYGGFIANPYGKTKFTVTDIACAYRSGHQSDFHDGWDLSVGGNPPIYAVMSGTVVSAYYSSGYGNHVIVRSGDMYVLYGHLNSMSVKTGDKVSAGTKIGTQGNTGHSHGNHLHLEFRKGKNSIANSTANLNAMQNMLKKYAQNYPTIKSEFGDIKR